MRRWIAANSAVSHHLRPQSQASERSILILPLASKRTQQLPSAVRANSSSAVHPPPATATRSIWNPNDKQQQEHQAFTTTDDIWRTRTEKALESKSTEEEGTVLLNHWTQMHTEKASGIAWKLHDTYNNINFLQVLDHWRRCVVTYDLRVEECPWAIWKRTIAQGYPPKALSMLLHTLASLTKYHEKQNIRSLFETIVEFLKTSQKSDHNVVVWNSALKAHVELWPETAYNFFEKLPVSDARSIAIVIRCIRDAELAKSLYKRIPETEAESQSFSLNHLLKIHPNYMKLFHNSQAIATKFMYRTVVSRLCYDNRIDEAVRLLQKQIDTNDDTEDLQQMMHAIIKKIATKDPAKAEYLLVSSNVKHAESVNVVMNAWVEKGNLARAKLLLHDDTYAYTIFMKGLAKTQKAFDQNNECLNLFENMKKRNIPRSPVTFATVLRSLVKQHGSAEIAEGIFRQYHEETQQLPEGIMFKYMIAIWAQSNAPNASVKANVYFDQWRGNCLRDPSYAPPDHNTIAKLIRIQSSPLAAHRLLHQVDIGQRKIAMYRHVLELWKREGTRESVARMRELIDEMKRIPACLPTVGIFLKFLKALAKARHANVARNVLEKEIHEPDSLCYGVVIGACENDPMMAHELYDEMKARSIQPCLYTYGQLLKIWKSNIGHPEAIERAEEIYHDMEADKTSEPGVWHQEVLMTMHAQLGKVEPANHYFDLICTQIDARLPHYNTMLTAYQKSEPNANVVPAATGLVQIMLQKNIRPDAFTYTILVHIFRINEVSYSEAKLLVEGMIRLAHLGESLAAPNHVTWHAMLDYWTKPEPPHRMELEWIERNCGGDEAAIHRIRRIRELLVQ